MQRKWNSLLDYEDRGRGKLPTYRLVVGHGDCEECDVSVGCRCKIPGKRHWCKRHKQLEMG